MDHRTGTEAKLSRSHGVRSLLIGACRTAGFAVLLLSFAVATASARIYYVKPGAGAPNDGSSWETAFVDLQSAIDAAVSGDSIWVARGTYKPAVTTATPDDATFVFRNGVNLFGGFSGTESSLSRRDINLNPTVLSGEVGVPGSKDNCYHVVTAMYPNASGTLDGFTITGGNADGVSGTDQVRGGGMYIYAGSHVLRNLWFTDNQANDSGGGLFVLTGNPTIENVDFSDNKALMAGGGMRLDQVNGTIKNPIFRHNSAPAGGGLELVMANPYILNGVFYDNSATNAAPGGGGGGLLNIGSSPVLVNASFYGNTSRYVGGAIYNEKFGTDNSSPTIVNSILWGNTAFIGGQEVHNDAGSTPAFSHSLIKGSGGSGTAWDAAVGIDHGDNIDTHPRFQNAAQGDFRLLTGSPAINAGDNDAPQLPSNDIEGNPRIQDGIVDLGAYEHPPGGTPITTVIYVNQNAMGDNDGSSWENAFSSLSSALDVALSGNQIWVAEGTYVPFTTGTPDSATFAIPDGVELYGGFAGTESSLYERTYELHPTGLSGANSRGGPEGFCHHVVSLTVPGATAVIDGFYIGSGYADGASGSSEARGAGMYLVGGTYTLRNLTFSYNWARDDGGGLCIIGSTITLENVKFSHNEANTGVGGGMYIREASPTLALLKFEDNTAATGGGLGLVRANPTLRNVLFARNSSTDAAHGGGALCDLGSSPVLINVTCTSNTTAGKGGGIYNALQADTISSPAVKNSILSGNAATGGGAQVYNDTGTLTTFQYSLIRGSGGSGGSWDTLIGTDGGNNIDVEPRFAISGSGDYRLDYGCAAINRGANSYLDLPLYDLDGNNRIFGGVVDMGAYEFTMNCTSGSVVYVDSAATTGLNDGTSWENAVTDLQAALTVARVCPNVKEIWVARGTYKPTPETDRMAAFEWVSGASLYGGFAGTETSRDQRALGANPTVLSGEIGGPGQEDNCFHVVIGNYPDRYGTLDGFTITGGYANGSSNYPPSQGGGMFIYAGDHTLRNLKFVGNHADASGGALYAMNSSLNIDNVIFTSNSADGGGAISIGANDTTQTTLLKNVIFTDNNAWTGGALDIIGTNPIVTNAVFFGNHSGGVPNNSGGAIRNMGASPVFTNVALCGNSCEGLGTGSAVSNERWGSYPCEPKFYNSIVWANTGGSALQIYNNGAAPTFHNSLIEESGGSPAWNTSFGIDGSGNLDTDPLFVNGPAGNLHITKESPAKDSGTNAAPNVLPSDLDGNPRIAWGTIDMGAYEVQGTNITVAGITAPDTAFSADEIGSKITVFIRNTDSEPIPQDFAIALYLSSDATITKSDVPLIDGAQIVHGIGGGETMAVPISGAGKIPSDMIHGHIYLGAIIDTANAIPEALEYDNTGSTPILIDPDSDNDGVPNNIDLCATPEPSVFDANGDGCPDSLRSARRVEFWDSRDFPLPYAVNREGAKNISDGSDLAAVENALSTWSNAPGTTVSFYCADTTDQRDAQALDGVNLITFSDPDFLFPNGVIAVGISTSFTEATVFKGRMVRPGEIVDADMIFNPKMSFKTPSAGSGINIQSVATHEAGHLLGLSHSAVVTSTMNFVLNPGSRASTLKVEDRIALLTAYPRPDTLRHASLLKGRVLDGATRDPVPGAIVFAIDAVTGDTLGCDYTLPEDGGFAFLGLPDGSYYVAIHPLDGTAAVGYIKPAYINQIINASAITQFVPEYYDDAESSNDNPASKSAVLVSAGSTRAIDILTNKDYSRPHVVAVVPDSTATNTRIDAAIAVSFSEPIEIASVEHNFSLLKMPSGQRIAGAVSLVRDDSTLIFVPQNHLDFETTYEIKVDTGIVDKSGNYMERPVIIHFRTESMPDVYLASVVPEKGVAGSIVVLNGAGFDSSAAEDRVLFGEIPATIRSASAVTIVATVPEAASPGGVKEIAVTVTNIARSQTSNAMDYAVLRPDEVPRGFENGTARLSAAPRQVAVSPDGKYAYASTSEGLAAIKVLPGVPDYLQTATKAISGGIDGLAISPTGKRAYGISSTLNKLFVINTDHTDPTYPYLVIVRELSLGARPVGIVAEPTGHRGFILMSNGEIEIWDLNPASATYASQTGKFISPDPNLLAAALHPAGTMLVAITGTGKMIAFDVSTQSVLAQVQVGFNLQDICIDPRGQYAYITSDNGVLSAVSLSQFTKLVDVQTGGRLQGVCVSPGGSFLYAANSELNVIDIIDLRPGSATDFSVAANISLPHNPIDVALSPSGEYLYSVTGAENDFIATSVGTGPMLSTASPLAAPVHAKVVLAGADFAAGSSTWVDLNGLAITPDSLSDSTLTITVPTGAVSGPIRVMQTMLSGQTGKSNELYFQVLGATEVSGLRLESMLQPGGFPRLAAALAVSPKGDYIAIGGRNGNVYVLDSRTGSASYHQFIRPFAVGDSVLQIRVSPDAKRAFVVARGASQVPVFDVNLPVFDVNPLRPNVGTALDTLNLPSGSPTRVLPSPDGRRCFVYDQLNKELVIFDIEPGSPSAYSRIATVSLSAYSEGGVCDMVFHPSGRYAYLAMDNPNQPSVLVLDSDPQSPSYREIVASVALPGPAPREIPISLAFTPDGARCLLLTSRVAGAPNHSVIMLNTHDPRHPAITFVHAYAGAVASRDEQISVSPRGDRAIFNVRGIGFFNAAITTSPDSLVVIEQTGDPSDHQAPVASDYTFDGSLFCGISCATDRLLIYDFRPADSLRYVSGNHLSGVIAQTLPAPLRVRVVSAARTPVAGIPITFEVLTGDGTLSSDGSTKRVVVSDEAGIAEISWVLGPVLGSGKQSVSATSLGLRGSPIKFFATSRADPQSLPLLLLAVAPLDGAADISITTALQVVFNRPVDPGSVTSATFSFTEHATGQPVPAVIGFSDENRRAALIPRSPLTPSTEYSLSLTSRIRGAVGDTLANPGEIRFTTSARQQLTLDAISPPSGPRGIRAMITGTGFDPIPAKNTVLFGSTPAPVLDAAEDWLQAVVPYDTSSDTVRVTVGGKTSNPLIFKILAPDSSLFNALITNVTTGSAIRTFAITPDGAYVYAVSPDANSVVPVNTSTLKSLPGIPVGRTPSSIAIHPDGALAYVANLMSGTVSVIDISPRSQHFNSVVQTIPVGLYPMDLAVTPKGDRLVVADFGTSDLSIIDADSSSETYHRVLVNVRTGTSVRTVSITPDGSLFYVGTDDGYIALDCFQYGVVASIRTGAAIRSTTITPDGLLLALLTTTGEVLIYDIAQESPTRDQLVATIRTGSPIRTITITPDGLFLYLVMENSNTIQAWALNYKTSVGVAGMGVNKFPIQVRADAVDTISTLSGPADIIFDPANAARAFVANAGDQSVSVFNTGGAIMANISVNPRPLTSPTRGRWILATIDLPAPYAVSNIGIKTIKMNDTIPADSLGWSIGDDNHDGIPDLSLRFDRVRFQSLMPNGANVIAKLSGKIGARYFSGLDTITTIRPTAVSPSGKGVAANEMTEITWGTPEGCNVDSVDIYWTANDGSNWNQIVHGLSNSGCFAWVTPPTLHDSCRVMVTFYAGSKDIGMGMSPEMFALVESTGDIPSVPHFALDQNVPNPFNPTTRISFSIPGNGQVKLCIFDVTGRRVRTLINAPMRAGHYSLLWNGRNDAGRVVSTGIYFYRLEAGPRTATRKMVLLK